ncbi:MAG: cobyrinate a,c-diamide synthase [Rhodocyclaceae bacterium]|nr:cobyrinate a,c-diamide synthase [Rhodocyclaceae bacterium]MBX3667476.1 cobyrinate a,c-diamide synthase [Rhodocyclaceae bacterium]
MTRRCSAWVVSAPASGQGKTTVVAALARLHARAGRKVRVFKCGPDFLDPQVHALASGAPCENIDFAMCGEDDAQWRLARAAAAADVILVEGVMGLHDGQPNVAELAQKLKLPILLVMDASAMAGSFGAIVWGMKHYRDGAPITHVLANRVGGDYHAQLCRATLPADIAWLGHLPRDPRGALPERHLGILPAGEIGDLDARIEHMADLLEATSAAQWQPQVDIAPLAPPNWPELLTGRRIAVARDAAFCFLYPANLECLQAMGAKLEFFSPLDDAAPPPCDAIWLPGGYPELHGASIARNRSMADALAAHHAAGKPLLAECGGMMACLDSLHDAQGAVLAMFGLLPGTVRMRRSLAGLGVLNADLPEGRLSGHTFHFSTADTTLKPIAQASARAGPSSEAVYRAGRLTASYMHFYFPSNAAAAARLFLP